MTDWVLIGKLAYDGAQVATLLIVIRLGGSAERWAVLIMIVAGAGTAINAAISVHTRVPARYGVCIVDVGALLAFDAIMIRSGRIWPICATGVQLSAVALDLAKIVTATPKSHLWVQGKFAYLIMIIVVIGCVCRPPEPRSKN